MRLNGFEWSALVALLSLFGCQPEIGDECRLHSDCSAAGDRICDPTFRGGYCTVFNCEPGGCPEEAACVAYRTSLAAAPECSDPAAAERLTRTFCMRSCSSAGDCRSGYDCVDLSAENPWGAVVVERGQHSRKVCTIPASGILSSAGGETGVCRPPESPFPEPPDAAVEAGAADAAEGSPDADASTRPEGAAPDAADAGEAGALDAALDAAPEASLPDANADANLPDAGSDARGDR